MVGGHACLLSADGTVYVLADAVTIGRAPENDIVLDQPTVSRRHARLTCVDGRWFVEDRGSFNGTQLNDARVPPGQSLPLRHADRLAIGAEALVFSCPGSDVDTERTEAVEAPVLAKALSPLQLQVVRILCASWLSGGSLDSLPSNAEIAVQLGTPGAVETVKAALRRAYAKAGLSSGTPYSKRRELCIVARRRGWI